MDNLLELVKTKKVELIDSSEVSSLRKSTKEAAEELYKYKTRMSKHNDLVYECNCEGPLPSCSYIHSVNPERDPRRPQFCPLDGNGCRWKKVEEKKTKKKTKKKEKTTE